MESSSTLMSREAAGTAPTGGNQGAGDQTNLNTPPDPTAGVQGSTDPAPPAGSPANNEPGSNEPPSDSNPGQTAAQPTDTRGPDLAGPEARPSNFVHRDPLSYPELAQGFEPPSEPAGNAVDLDAVAWKQVLDINQLLHGFQIRQENQDVVRARQNAFDLIARPGNAATPQMPCFQVEDGTLVEVYETRNDLQRSLARNAFSKRSIETNLSAGDFGVDVGPVWRREGEKTKMAEVWTETRDQEYYAAYIYPRARIFLDEDELQISAACKAELVRLKANPSFQSLQKFYRRFGHVFVTSVLLGGQQKTTKFAGAMDRQDNARQQDAIRWAVGAKVNAPYANAGVQYSREKGSGEDSAEKDYVNSSYLALSATGGDTLIGSDIPKWAPTIAPYKNWRVVKNEIALPIQEVIGAVEGWSHVPQLFREIHDSRAPAERPWKGRLSLWVGDEPLYWDQTARRLVLRSSSSDGSEKAVFHALDPAQDESGRARPLDALAADRSVLLRTVFPGSGSDDLHVERGDTCQWLMRPGADAGRNPFRFSFRPAGATGQWNPKLDPAHVFGSGDKVNLYCHSLGLGPYLNIARPPTHASPAVLGRMVKPTRKATATATAGTFKVSAVFPDVNYEPDGPDSLHFPVPVEALPVEAKSLMNTYDSGYLEAGHKEAFEKMGIISTREFCPGPNVENVERTRGFSINPNVEFSGAAVGGSIGYSRETRRVEMWTRVEGKKYQVDYLQLQKVPALKRAPLEWDRCRMELLQSAGYPDVCDESPTAFRIVFE